MRHSRRGVSTVVDVMLGLVLISASVTLMSAHLTALPETRPDTTEADQTAQVLSTISMDVTYGVKIHFGDESNTYTFKESGTAAHHLKKATLLNAIIGSSKYVETDYPRQIDEMLTQRLRGAKYNYYIVSQWRPYGKPQTIESEIGSSDPVFYGRVTAGPTPPPYGNVSSARLTVGSGMDSARTVRSRNLDGGLSESIAVTVVDGYFPISETQFELARGEYTQAYAKDRYKRMALLVANENTESVSAELQAVEKLLGKNLPQTADLNAAMVSLVAPTIEDDISGIQQSVVENQLATGKIEITIKTWEQ